MGMKKYLFLVFAFFTLFSCTNKAVDFNNDLVKIQKSVLIKVQEFGKKMQQVNPDSLASPKIKSDASEISAFIEGKINEAHDVPAPKDGENLKDAIISQLGFEKNIVEKIGRLADTAISKEEKRQIETEFLASGQKATELESRVREAQESFAKQHKFNLEAK